MRAKLVDAKGNLVPESGRKVQFAANGGYELVGAGVSSTEAGIASALVRVRSPRGAVSAQADALKGRSAR